MVCGHAPGRGIDQDDPCGIPQTSPYVPSEHNTACAPRLLRLSHADTDPCSLSPLSVVAVHLGVLTRKSTINAGTRYYARGLNKAGGPGNESECELLMWTTTAHSDLVRQKESRLCSPSATAPLPSTR